MILGLLWCYGYLVFWSGLVWFIVLVAYWVICLLCLFVICGVFRIVPYCYSAGCLWMYVIHCCFGWLLGAFDGGICLSLMVCLWIWLASEFGCLCLVLCRSANSVAFFFCGLERCVPLLIIFCIWCCFDWVCLLFACGVGFSCLCALLRYWCFACVVGCLCFLVVCFWLFVFYGCY